MFTTAILAFIATVNEYLLMSQLSNEKTAPVTVAWHGSPAPTRT